MFYLFFLFLISLTTWGRYTNNDKSLQSKQYLWPEQSEFPFSCWARPCHYRTNNCQLGPALGGDSLVTVPRISPVLSFVLQHESFRIAQKVLSYSFYDMAQRG